MSTLPEYTISWYLIATSYDFDAEKKSFVGVMNKVTAVEYIARQH